MISTQELAKVIRNKDHMYKACLANGFHLPSRRSAFCTLKLMQEISQGTGAIPAVSDIKFRTVLHPPNREYLIQAVTSLIDAGVVGQEYQDEEQAKSWKRLAKYIRKAPPEKQWLIGLLSFLNPGSEIFEKGYRPPV